MKRNCRETKSFKYRGAIGVHFFYVVVILSMAVILLATKEWTKLDGFTDYLTAAGTMTSLVLGVLAIIYSFISSRQQTDVIGSIEISSRTISQAVGQLNTLSNSAQSLQKRAEDRTESLVEIVSQLRDSVSAVQDITGKISEQSSDIAGRVQTVQSQLETLAKPANPTDPEAPAITAEYVERTLGISSVWGLCAVTLVVEAHRANKGFNLSEYVKHGGPSGGGYMNGFLIGWDCAGFFDLSVPEKTEAGSLDKKYVVSAMHPQLDAALEAEWAQRVADAKETTKLRWQKYRSAAILALCD